MKNNNENPEDFSKTLRNLNDILESLKNESENDSDFDALKAFTDLNTELNNLDELFFTDVTKLELPYKKLNPDAVSPKYNYESDSGFDLHSVEEIVVPPLGRALVPTGLSFDVKDGYEIQVRSKSGLAINQGLMCLNSPGTVDSGYLGEIKVIIFNTNQEPFTILKGMKVAQAVLCPVANGRWVNPIEKDELSKKDRGDNGFGSTGILNN